MGFLFVGTFAQIRCSKPEHFYIKHLIEFSLIFQFNPFSCRKDQETHLPISTERDRKNPIYFTTIYMHNIISPQSETGSLSASRAISIEICRLSHCYSNYGSVVCFYTNLKMDGVSYRTNVINEIFKVRKVHTQYNDSNGNY